MRGKYLFGGKNLFAIAGGVRGDLGGFGATVAGLFEMLFDLLRAGTRRVQIFLGIAFDLRRTALPCLDFVAKVSELIGQSGLVNSRRIVLRIKEALRLTAREEPSARTVTLKITA